MKCFRAKLSERRENSAHVTGRESNMAANMAASPRHYCQRRMADASHDEREWIRRYTPERFHLTTLSPNESEGESGATTRLSDSETPEMIEIKTPKNVFRPAFLTVTNLDLPPNLPTAEPNTWSRRKARYKTVPKHCSGHMHRMFVKNSVETDEPFSRSSSRASTEYEHYNFEEYMGLDIKDDSSDISLFQTDGESRYARLQEESSNNNDSLFMNMNDIAQPVKPDSTTHKKKEQINKNVSIKIAQQKEDVQNNRITVPLSHKKERRKSINLSRIPSPETVQVIRIDVISGYPVDSESLLSEITDSDAPNSEIASQLNFDANISKNSDISKRAEQSYQSWKNTFEDINCVKVSEVKNSCSLLNCKSLSLSNRN